MEVLSDFYTIALLKNSSVTIKINNQIFSHGKYVIILIPVSQLKDIGLTNFKDGCFIFFEGEFIFLNKKTGLP